MRFILRWRWVAYCLRCLERGACMTHSVTAHHAHLVSLRLYRRENEGRADTIVTRGSSRARWPRVGFPLPRSPSFGALRRQLLLQLLHDFCRVREGGGLVRASALVEQLVLGASWPDRRQAQVAIALQNEALPVSDGRDLGWIDPNIVRLLLAHDRSAPIRQG